MGLWHSREGPCAHAQPGHNSSCQQIALSEGEIKGIKPALVRLDSVRTTLRAELDCLSLGSDRQRSAY